MLEPGTYLVNELLPAAFRRGSFSEEINALVGKTELGKITCSPASVCVCVLGDVPGISYYRVGGERGGLGGVLPEVSFLFSGRALGQLCCPPQSIDILQD